jgi:hypothetical protein
MAIDQSQIQAGSWYMGPSKEVRQCLYVEKGTVHWYSETGGAGLYHESSESDFADWAIKEVELRWHGDNYGWYAKRKAER